MKQYKPSPLEYANAIDVIKKEKLEVMRLLAIYKRALFGACCELAQLLDNANPKTDEEYWLLEAIKIIDDTVEVI